MGFFKYKFGTGIYKAIEYSNLYVHKCSQQKSNWLQLIEFARSAFILYTAP